MQQYINDGIFALLKLAALSLEKSGNNFGIAFFLALTIATATAAIIFALGKNGSFFLLNGNHNSYFDLFFKYYTHAGDGWTWVPVVLACIFFKKKYLVAVIAGIVFSTLLGQILKRVVFPDELRPITFLADNFPVHIIDGVYMLKTHSFPSGHTTTAFTIALILAHIINKKSWSVILPLLALLAGYSRVYLGEHFLTDVLAGICIGILSAILALMVYKSFIKILHIKKPSGIKAMEG